ncbi:hypothetical protein [Inquilinus sp. CA228]|uniref:hypothetical protein n=1 Tax=Inquilinus sp. CA228 TaxID=3455609 RepID=UPI003F8D43A4
MEILDRVGQALQLIKTHDPYRYRRVLNELDRVWVHLLPNGAAHFVPELRRCVIDPRLIVSSSSEFIASVIVHEATHGRLMRYRVGYSEEIRRRVEILCMRQEQAFARRIPNGEELKQSIDRRLGLPPETWTDEAFSEGNRIGEIEMARHAGIPKWLTWILVRLRKMTAGRRY